MQGSLSKPCANSGDFHNDFNLRKIDDNHRRGTWPLALAFVSISNIIVAVVDCKAQSYVTCMIVAWEGVDMLWGIIYQVTITAYKIDNWYQTLSVQGSSI